MVDNGLELTTLWVFLSSALGAGNVALESSSDQQVTISFGVGAGLHFVTCVYGNVLSLYLRQLWNNLVGLSSICVDSWHVIGDFNCCFGSHEK